MKKTLRLSLLVLGATATVAVKADSDDLNRGALHPDETGHTFFSVRAPFQAASPEQITLFRGRALAKDCGWNGALQVVPFGGQSTNQSALGRYFMFCHKDALVVAGDAAFGVDPVTGLGRDVNSAHFNIQPALSATNNFYSTISFSPRQTFAGVGFQWRQYLGWNGCCERKWWLDISLPVEWVKNNVDLEETVSTAITAQAGAYANMTQAFVGNLGLVNQLASTTGAPMAYGLIGKACSNKQGRTRTGVADVEVKIGYDWLCSDCAHAESYLGIHIPTGNKPKAVYVFEPIVGNNFHVGIMTGGAFGAQVWSGDCDRNLWWEFELNSTYLFRNTQRRSFDVCNKSWSRYMAVYANAVDAASQTLSYGINYLTQKLHVSPRFTVNFTSALVYSQCSFQGELGYNFWARQGEKVRLAHDWYTTNSQPAFASINGGTTAANRVQKISTIGANGQNALSSGTGTALAYSTVGAPIQATDLDLATAAHPAALSHTVYGTLGYCFDSCCMPMFVGVGGSYEFTGVNTALNRYMIWGKLGFSF